MIDNRTKVKIIKDYSFTIKGDPSAPIGQIGGSPREDITFSFKVGQIVEGYIYHSKKEIQVRVGNYLVPIPKENWELVNKEQNVVNQPVVNETINLGVIKQDAEDKFYEKLGIKTQVGGFMSGKIASKSKGRALILLVLVAGYFAYKKFKN